MNHRLPAAMFWVLAALGSGSCDSSDVGGPPGPRDRPVSCERLTTCATCTPVLGCGWCQSGDKGLCASDPHHCARAETFTWTWELAFCPATAEAGALDASAWPDATLPSDGLPADLGQANHE